MRLAGFLFLWIAVFLVSGQEKPQFKFHGLKIFVHDLNMAQGFYGDLLGFKITGSGGSPKLETNSWPIYLEKAKSAAGINYPFEARTGLSIQTYKLLPQIDSFRESGVLLYDTLLGRNGVGISIPFQDPSGNVLSLIEVQIREIPKFEGISIYNTGVTISDMDAATAFYQGILGFEDWSRNYLPDALPLKHSDGSFAFMIHYRKGLKKSSINYGKAPHLALVLTTQDLNQAKSFLEIEKVTFTSDNGNIICQDPEGNFVEIWESKEPN